MCVYIWQCIVSALVCLQLCAFVVTMRGPFFVNQSISSFLLFFWFLWLYFALLFCTFKILSFTISPNCCSSTTSAHTWSCGLCSSFWFCFASSFLFCLPFLSFFLLFQRSHTTKQTKTRLLTVSVKNKNLLYHAQDIWTKPPKIYCRAHFTQRVKCAANSIADFLAVLYSVLGLTVGCNIFGQLQ